MSVPSLATGFDDPVQDGQRVFRAVLDAMSRPGRIVPLPRLPEIPAGLHASSAAVALALLDLETPVWLDEAASPAAKWLRFHCGSPLTAAAGDAAFALIADGTRLPDLDLFPIGTPDYPERGTTLLIQVAALAKGRGHRLRGPGIEHETFLDAEGLDEALWRHMAQGRDRFPLGHDVMLLSPDALACLPRSIILED
ncbi:phosphonate C-P lyase system protein PhnH [Telmatospirillum sp. J64-1]|uniref:phosphonate C-P lyase system protein PhnH n=1 Tax=Telmatospirillum sp. J64-1 TaxID=2502183 RepID=UPI00115F721E|nr:phosphonate C-P lyase system protein PhnH [Telmatospirillum sp. J64-1]